MMAIGRSVCLDPPPGATNPGPPPDVPAPGGGKYVFSNLALRLDAIKQANTNCKFEIQQNY